MKIKEKYWHWLFVFSVAIKTVTGIIETVSGAMVLASSPAFLAMALNKISHGEMSEQPADLFFAYANQALRHLTVGDRIFAGLYILAHGLINLFIVLGLVKNKPAAYLVAIGVLIAFILYQIPRFLMHHSPILGVLTIFDLLFVVLVYHEYTYMVKKPDRKAF